MSQLGKPCRCGSGEPCYDLTDARGIFIAYVCEKCEASRKEGFRPDIFTDSQYPCDERIEPLG